MAARGEGPGVTPLAVVIPAYRAAATVASVVHRALGTVAGAHVCVVDDGSDDDTAMAARGAGADVVALSGNQGKGAALAAGVERVVASGAGLVVTLDADGQHEPAELVRLAAPLAAGRADLVLGARTRTAAMPAARRLSNWLSAVLVSRVAGHPVPDAQTGFRAFTRAVALRIHPAEVRYDYELAFLLGALRAGFRVASVPVATIYDGASSHFRSLADTWRITRVFARYGGSVLLGPR
jgi:glycosyltransferase involved in cell wall biosynthesis